MTKYTSHADVADKMKAEIRALIADGTIPEEVGSFSELHDHIDANMLADEFFAGPTDTETEAEAEARTEANASLFNAASAIVDEWLAAGNHRTVTVTVTMTVSKWDWEQFKADNTREDILESFAARMTEVFGNTEVLTTAEVQDVQAE